MTENNPKAGVSVPVTYPVSIISGLCDRLSVLCPSLPRAIPLTQKQAGRHFLIGIEFETAAEAENFAKGIEGHCDRIDGARLFLKRPPVITVDERGNCSGVN